MCHPAWHALTRAYTECVFKCVYVCMYVCMYVRIYVCMYVCIYICMCTHTHKHTHLHARTHTSARAHTEWWIQRQRLTAGGGGSKGLRMHYDKDEAFLAQASSYRFPDVSSVTYLTNDGAPTMIFNRTAAQRGGQWREGAVLSFPRRGRHLRFRGDLLHGVPGQLTPRLRGGRRESERVTFLVNFWAQKPRSPNCGVLSSAALSALGLPRDRQNTSETSECAATPVDMRHVLIPGGERAREGREGGEERDFDAPGVDEALSGALHSSSSSARRTCKVRVRECVSIRCWPASA